MLYFKMEIIYLILSPTNMKQLKRLALWILITFQNTIQLAVWTFIQTTVSAYESPTIVALSNTHVGIYYFGELNLPFPLFGSSITRPRSKRVLYFGDFLTKGDEISYTCRKLSWRIDSCISIDIYLVHKVL